MLFRNLFSAKSYEMILDYIISKKATIKQVDVFIDLKNAMNSLFLENVMEDLINNSKDSPVIDSSIFQSIIRDTASWKMICNQAGVTSRIFLISDIGSSVYHTQIYKDYKKNRYISSVILHESLKKIDEDTKLTEEEKQKKRSTILRTIYFNELCDKFRPIRMRNFELAEKTLNRVPKIYFFTLKHIESDFLAYYLIKYKLNNLNREDVLNIVFSNDHDMFQMLHLPNVLQIFKSSKGTSLIDRQNILVTLFENLNSEIITKFDLSYIDVLYGLTGDPGDDVPGLKGVGNKVALQLLSDKKTVENILPPTKEELDNRALKGESIFNKNSFDYLITQPDTNIWKRLILKQMKVFELEAEPTWRKIEETVTTAYRLISFEQLSKWLIENDSIFKIETNRSIDNLLNKESLNNSQLITNPYVLYNTLTKWSEVTNSDLILSEQNILALFL